MLAWIVSIILAKLPQSTKTDYLWVWFAVSWDQQSIPSILMTPEVMID